MKPVFDYFQMSLTIQMKVPVMLQKSKLFSLPCFKDTSVQLKLNNLKINHCVSIMLAVNKIEARVLNKTTVM